MNRRGFLQTVAGTTFAFHVVPRHVLGRGFTPPSEKLNIAGIGIGGQGGGVIRDMATENIVALCDVDSNKAAGTFKAFPKAEQFRDYRVLLDQRKDIDAVMIATPDHMHAPITIAALRAGKHVYVEKPMAHSIEEARVMTRVARETGLVTQMGNNGHAGEGLRLTREWLEAGAIGPVREIHCWSDRPGKWWVQNHDRPPRRHRFPPALDWDLWIGAAPMRPYSKLYHPARWRGWFDFGTGALGDMAIHNMDPAFYALDLGTPAAVEATTSELKPESYPLWTVLRYEFAAKGDRPAVTLTWYDGGKMPPRPRDLPGGHRARRQRDLLRRRQGDARLRRLVGPADPLPGEPPQGIPDPPADDPPLDRAPPGVDRGVQGPQAGGRQGRICLFGHLHRGTPGGKPGSAPPEADRMGRGQHAGFQRPRG